MEFSIPAPGEEGDERKFTLSFSSEISIHALREEGDTVSGYTKAQVLKFLSTPSARRATCMRQEQNSSICISIHALREEGDPTTPVTVRCMFLFLSTPSARRATMSGQGSFVPTEDFYPRPPRGGRRLLICAADLGGHISIHALREEGDNAFTANERAALLFLSTPSARRATRLNFRASSIVGYFYPRPPRGGRRAVHRPLRGCEDISIHALREEGDS